MCMLSLQAAAWSEIDAVFLACSFAHHFARHLIEQLSAHERSHYLFDANGGLGHFDEDAEAIDDQCAVDFPHAATSLQNGVRSTRDDHFGAGLNRATRCAIELVHHALRSEERRVGKEWRSRWSAEP